MSILDIILITAGVIIIGLYAFIEIKKTIKWRKIVKELISKGTPIEKAKIQANEMIYKKKNKAGKDKTPKEIEEDIFEE